ncbi:zinc finger E-box-binding homeobox 1-like isoform X1 [Oncorhynchus kisutch]|uniref:zinc finger E-box-binding homeobox 1-like isoform X1 n=1 Tax=Oncorhynchus kisutch TaxID=8019 RepID=UPI0012DCACC8|nr:zinc finger E-box-binding homeobox 1-like isoform X1 [Oncorhynchus kisutch]
MADGPRCKRRKQANPKRNNVTNYNNVVEAQSDSDDEDKLHIVEEDPDGDSTVPEDTSVVLTQNGTETHQDTWDGVKEDCGSEEEDEEEGEEGEEGGKDALVEEMLQLGDTAVIYPEAPEDEQKSMPERRVPDENGTPDALSQLLTCPYCSRGYKRCTALKEHIKLRHEKSEDNFSCSQCSYTFAYRTQLDRHMTQHKTQHKEPVQRHMPQTTTTTGGNRKFMCTECSKAFKYKHHLKEHLRIHSGEKPYECPNCKKRFSHSGSYSSHISSKKCVGMVPVNGTPRPVMKASQTPTTQNQLSGTAPVAPTRLLLRGEKTDGKPLQEQLPVNQIKSEPVEYEYKPVAVGPNGAAGTNGTVFTGGMAVPQGTVQAVVLPTVGLMSPISINLSDLQNVLKVAMDGNVFRQVLGTANGLVTSKQGVVGQAGQQVISAISLPGFVDQDGTTKIIINYTLEPSLAQQPSAPQLLKKEPLPAPTTTNTQPASKVTEKLIQDLSIIKTEQPDSESEKEMEKEEAPTEAEAEQSKEGETPKAQTGKTTCLLCDDCPGGLDALHMLQHCKPTNGEGGDGSPLDPSIAALLAEAGITPGQPPLKNLLSLLKAYFALNAEPTEEELAKISDNVSLPVDIVKKWFEKMQSGQITVEPPGSSSPLPSTGPSTETQAAQEKSGEQTEEQLASAQTQETSSSQPPNSSPASTSASPLVSALAPSPLNLSSSGRVIVKTEEDSEGESQDLPLDLSLPKQPQSEPQVPHVPQEQPLNLTCLKKETSQPQLQAQLQPQLPGFQTQLQSQLQPQLQAQIQAQLQPQLQAQLQPQLPGFQTQLQAQGTTNTIYVTSPPQMATSSPVNIMTTQLVAITNQGSGVPCLRAISTGTTKRTILIPQLTYTYTTKAGSNATGADGAQKTVILNGCQEEEKADTSSESVSAVEEQNDSDSAPPQKKMRRLESGMYACDLCDKIFQKSSSLLRHKYEHTGKRPHECGICNKAFKHKHHLIEHTRLHSGEKPYRCDKCGKCFSHSGSYSQHMNHRYSYCKKEPQGDHQVGRRLRMTPEMSSQAEEQQSDSRPTSPPSQLDSDERESEEELEEEEGEEEGMEAMSMDDIRVVQVGEDDEESEIYEVEEFEGVRQEEEEEGSREEEAQQEEEEGQQEEEEAQQEEEEEEGSREEEAQQEEEEGQQEEEEAQQEEEEAQQEKEEEEGSREEEAQQEEEEGQQENKEEGRREEEKSVQQEQVCEEEEEGRREEEEEGRREEEAHQKEGEEEEWRREEESREESVQQEKDVYEKEEEEEMEVQVMGDGEGEEGEAEKETVVTEEAKETEDKEPHVDKENITETLENGQKETEENKMNSE